MSKTNLIFMLQRKSGIQVERDASPMTQVRFQMDYFQIATKLCIHYAAPTKYSGKYCYIILEPIKRFSLNYSIIARY